MNALPIGGSGIGSCGGWPLSGMQYKNQVECGPMKRREFVAEFAGGRHWEFDAGKEGRKFSLRQPAGLSPGTHLPPASARGHFSPLTSLNSNGANSLLPVSPGWFVAWFIARRRFARLRAGCPWVESEPAASILGWMGVWGSVPFSTEFGVGLSRPGLCRSDTILKVQNRGGGAEGETASPLKGGVVRDLPPKGRGPLNLPFLGISVNESAWILATGARQGVNTPNRIHYWGHYPVADIEYELDTSVGISVRACALSFLVTSRTRKYQAPFSR